MRYVLGAVILIVVLVVYLTDQNGDQDTITGTVTHVRDGDTIEVADVPVRLNGVAAPELNERFGRESKSFMTRLVSGKTVRCELNGERSFDRVIGTCYLDGADIGGAVIAAGLAQVSTVVGSSWIWKPRDRNRYLKALLCHFVQLRHWCASCGLHVRCSAT